MKVGGKAASTAASLPDGRRERTNKRGPAEAGPLLSHQGLVVPAVRMLVAIVGRRVGRGRGRGAIAAASAAAARRHKDQRDRSRHHPPHGSLPEPVHSPSRCLVIRTESVDPSRLRDCPRTAENREDVSEAATLKL